MMFSINSKFTLTGIFLFVLLLTSCHAQEIKDKKVTMDELLKQELQNQENAKHGNKNPQIEVISDPLQVAKLKDAILRKIKQRDRAVPLKVLTPWDRYKRHDKSAVPILLAILKGNDAKKRAEVYVGLRKEYDEPGNYTITEPELIGQILKGIENPADEEDAVQLAGLNQLPGYESSFEKRLLSGRSSDEGRIFFWLGHEGKSRPAFDYIEKGIRTKRITGKNLDEAISGIAYFAQKGDAEIIRRTGDLALFIYQNKLISEDRFEDLKNSASTSDAAETVLQCLFDYGNEAVIPIANDILQRKIRIDGPLKALIRLEGAKHITKVFAYLQNEEDFFTGLGLVEELDNKLVTEELLKEVLVQFAKRKDIEDYLVQRIVELFKTKNAENFLKDQVGSIADKPLADRVMAAYKFSFVTNEDVLKDLLSIGLVDKMPLEADILKVTSEFKHNPSGFAYGILEQEGVFFNFDTETDFLPVDYDKLLLKFAAKSKGVLKDMLVWMDAIPNKGGETFQYTITVISNGKAFVTRPEDIGDWYDIPTVDAILDKVLTNLNAKERFVSIASWDQTAQYIFGEPNKAGVFIKKYK